MIRKIFALLVSFVLLAGVSYQSRAGGWYVGGGAQSVSFEDDLQNIDNGIGIIFSGGYDFNKNFGIDLMTGGSFHDESLLNSYAVQSFVMVGGKASLGSDSFNPYLVAGVSYHVVDFEFFEEISGSGVYFGVGADIFISKQSALNISFRTSDWNGDDSVFDYNVTTDFVSVAYNYYFSR